MSKSVKQIAQEIVKSFDCINTFKVVNGMTNAELAAFFFELGYARSSFDARDRELEKLKGFLNE